MPWNGVIAPLHDLDLLFGGKKFNFLYIFETVRRRRSTEMCGRHLFILTFAIEQKLHIYFWKVNILQLLFLTR